MDIIYALLRRIWDWIGKERKVLCYCCCYYYYYLCFHKGVVVADKGHGDGSIRWLFGFLVRLVLCEKDGIVIVAAAIALESAAATARMGWLLWFHRRSNRLVARGIKDALVVHAQTSTPEKKGFGGARSSWLFLGGKEIALGIDTEASDVVVVASAPECACVRKGRKSRSSRSDGGW